MTAVRHAARYLALAPIWLYRHLISPLLPRTCRYYPSCSAYAVEGKLRRGHPHPRNFGTFPRVLGVYVRERNLLRLEDAVRKMTSLSAAKAGLVDRGLLRPGQFADVAVFNAETIADRATYIEPFQYSEGVEYVLVNGQLVLDRGRHTDFIEPFRH